MWVSDIICNQKLVVQVTAFRLIGNKPLPEPMLSFKHLDTQRRKSLLDDTISPDVIPARQNATDI